VATLQSHPEPANDNKKKPALISGNQGRVKGGRNGIDFINLKILVSD